QSPTSNRRGAFQSPRVSSGDLTSRRKIEFVRCPKIGNSEMQAIESHAATDFLFHSGNRTGIVLKTCPRNGFCGLRYAVAFHVRLTVLILMRRNMPLGG